MTFDETAPPGVAARPAFDTTHWSVVLNARDASASDAASSLEALCRDYWFPLYTYMRRQGYAPADAQDVVQGFFTRVFEKDYLGQVSPEKGRFRSFLLAALKHYAADERDQARAQKRGGGAKHLSIDADTAEALFIRELPAREGETPDRAFDRSWALAVLGRAQRHLRDECAGSGKSALYDALGPEAQTADESYIDIGRRVGLSESAIKSAAFRLRQRYRELIRAEVAQTVNSEAELEAEISHLLNALAA